MNRYILTESCLALLIAGGVLYAASVSGTDKEFLNTAARMDMVQAHEASMAQNQASRADVKDLAKTLVQDHTQSYSAIAALATKDSVSIPKGINAARDHTIEQLVSLKGVHFDRQFANDEVAAERLVIAIYQREAAHGANPDVKAYATNTIPALQKDLKQAETAAKPVAHS